MHFFEPIKQSRASEEVLAQLKGAILQGAYKEGDKLPSERELTNLFNVSRGVVREAIRGLQVSGYVKIKQGPLGGAFVKENSAGLLEMGVSDLYSSKKLSINEVGRVRQYIEPEIARLAALNVTDGYRKKLEIALEQEKQGFESNEDLMNKLTAVHFILAEMSGNIILKNILISLISLTHQIINELLTESLLTIHRIGEHDDVFMSVITGDPEAARKSMAFHSACFCDAFVQLEKATVEKATAANSVQASSFPSSPCPFNGPGKK
ncbi:FadR/GntR family transcriptional regulator [Desulfosarcina ovata]|uniref:FadR/GntR family transcriptional regulator n=1 Tax=Desulfosarcina ovata TaxID=83564 RepID=UPI0012D345B4|nr:FadR/GntR family transcriptional regulator [Desulfosarcina ovata]